MRKPVYATFAALCLCSCSNLGSNSDAVSNKPMISAELGKIIVDDAEDGRHCQWVEDVEVGWDYQEVSYWNFSTYAQKTRFVTKSKLFILDIDQQEGSAQRGPLAPILPFDIFRVNVDLLVDVAIDDPEQYAKDTCLENAEATYALGFSRDRWSAMNLLAEATLVERISSRYELIDSRRCAFSDEGFLNSIDGVAIEPNAQCYLYSQAVPLNTITSDVSIWKITSPDGRKTLFTDMNPAYMIYQPAFEKTSV